MHHFSANCDGEAPFYPELGKYRPLALPVDDPNLGVVIRKFGIRIPEQYSSERKVEVSSSPTCHKVKGKAEKGQAISSSFVMKFLSCLMNFKIRSMVLSNEF